jgi:hypothetical protein
MSIATDPSKSEEQELLHTYRRGSDTKVCFRFKPDRRYENVLSENRHTEYPMINQTDAETVLNRQRGFEGILEPYHNLLITGTEKDEIVKGRSVYGDLDLLARLDRSVTFIPDYSWVYEEGMTDEKQLEAVRYYLDRLERLCERIDRECLTHVTVLPLAKGTKREHFEEMSETFERLGFDRYAFYAVQTRSLPRLIKEIRVSVTVLDPEEILVIGRGSPSEVAKLPSRVNGIASLRYWKDYVNLNSDGYSEPRLIEWRRMIRESLEDGRVGAQSRFSNFSEMEVSS